MMSSNQTRPRRGRGKEEKNDVSAKKEAKPNFPNHIPQDIVIEILSRLPLDSLSRFACVSKQWCASISNLAASKTGRQMVLVKGYLKKSGNLMFHSIDQECDVKRVPTPRIRTIPGYRNPKIFGSCNGLLLMGLKDDLFLWNPLTRYFKKVLSYEFLGQNTFRVVCGLCYDSSTDEYKALMAVTNRMSPGDRGFVVVGNLKSKTWTRVRFPYQVCGVKSGPIINGHPHWYVLKKTYRFFKTTQTLHRIVCFAPMTNKFFKVQMPEPKECHGDEVFGLGVMDGCLCMARREFDSRRGGENIEVLIMKEHGMKKSWTILFTISELRLQRDDQLVPLGYTNNGEALIKAPFGRDIRAYNPDDSSHRTISTRPLSYKDYAVMYEESLVTPIGYEWEEEEVKGGATYVEYFLNRSPRTMKKRRNGSWRCLKLEKKSYENRNTEEEYESNSEEYENSYSEYESDLKESDSEEY